MNNPLLVVLLTHFFHLGKVSCSFSLMEVSVFVRLVWFLLRIYSRFFYKASISFLFVVPCDDDHHLVLTIISFAFYGKVSREK